VVHWSVVTGASTTVSRYNKCYHRATYVLGLLHKVGSLKMGYIVAYLRAICARSWYVFVDVWCGAY
jgi:hypothetical protein